MRTPQQKALELLEEAKVSIPPVPVEQIAEQQGAKVRYAGLEGDTSGLLFRKGKKVVIGVNAFHSPARQRFTIAHELGHLKMHNGDFFIDRKLILYRNSRSGSGTDQREKEANEFAAVLLMPDEMVRREWKKNPIDLDDLEGLEKFAAKFQVSTQALTIRLNNLQLISF